MKGLTKRTTLVISSLLAIWLCLFLPARLWAQESLDGANGGNAERQLYHKIVSATKEVKSLSANFVEKKHIAALTEPVVSKGRIYYMAPSSMRWEYDAQNYGICNAKGGYMVRDGKINSGEGRVFAKLGRMITGFINGSDIDSKMFDVEYNKVGKEFHIKATPKNSKMRGLIEYILMRFDSDNYMIKGYSIFNGADSTVITFSDIDLSTQPNEQLFK